MRIDGVIWLEDVTEKIRTKHGLETWEVENVLRGRQEFRRGAEGTHKGQDLYYALGQTDSGRYLFVVFLHKRGNQALVLTARDMSQREKKGYRRRKRHG